MNREYINNYPMARISGLSFDLMIFAGVTAIEINDIGFAGQSSTNTVIAWIIFFILWLAYTVCFKERFSKNVT